MAGRMAEFRGVSEKFNVSLLSEDGGGSQRVICQIGLDGLFLLSPETQRTLRKFPLEHVSRWARRGNMLNLYTRTPSDIEERTITLQGDDRTIGSVLDTLTSSCMQMVELLKTSDTSTERDQEVAEALSALLNGNGNKKRTSLPTCDEVEFWKSPEKIGWLFSQGDVIKTWRRRWFVLKEGWLFRFGESDVKPSSKPRGVVDMTLITNVVDGREATGKPNSIRLTTSTGGQVCYLCDSETEQVEWISAFEGTLARIVKMVAGVEDEPTLPAAIAPQPRKGPASSTSEWARQLEAGFSAVSRSSPKPQRSSTSSTFRADGNPMVSVVGYGGGGGGGAGGGGGGSYSGGGGSSLNGFTAASSATPSDYGGYGTYSSVAGYGNVAGAKVAPARNEPLVHVDYGYSTATAPSSYSSTQTAGGIPGGGSAYDAPQYGGPPPAQQYGGGYSQEASAPYQSQAPSWQASSYDQHQAPAQQGGRADAFAATGGSYMDQAPSAYGAAAYPTMQPTVLAQQAYAVPEPSQSSDTGWTLHSSPDGRQYQYNTATGESRWAASDWLH